MSRDPKRTHGASPDEVKDAKPKILTAIRGHAPIDEKTGRAKEEERKVYIEGMEDELMEDLTEDQIATLEAGGYVQGMAVHLPSEQSLALDPTVRAGAGKLKKGQAPENAAIAGPRTQAQASTATVVGRAEAEDEEDDRASRPRRSGRKGGKKASKD